MKGVTARRRWSATVRGGVFGLCLSGAGLPLLAAGFDTPAIPVTSSASGKTGKQATATLQCEAVYLPARTTWPRRVDIGYDQKRVRTVHIDGVPVYTFSIRGTVILTALDNERIQIDTASRSWTSDFRGLATAQGRCIK